MIKKTFLICFIIFFLSSCATVKEYEKIDLNEPDMALSANKIDRFETNFHSYREAASGGSGGKTGGGCGCN